MVQDDESLSPGKAAPAPRVFRRRSVAMPKAMEEVKEEVPAVTEMEGLLLTHEQHVKEAGKGATVDASIHSWHLAHSMHIVSWSSAEALHKPLAVRTLLKFTLASNLAVRGEALAAVWNVSAEDEGAAVLVAHGGVQQLGRALNAADSEREACIGGQSAGLELRQSCVAAVRNLAVNSETAVGLFEAGVMPPLLNLLKENEATLDAKHDALLVRAAPRPNRCAVAGSGPSRHSRAGIVHALGRCSGSSRQSSRS